MRTLLVLSLVVAASACARQEPEPVYVEPAPVAAEPVFTGKL